jgi:hypothetical protein
MLTNFYAAMGNAPEVKGALAAMAEALLSKATPEQVSAALDACMFERFPVRLPHILAKLPGTEAAEVDAEKRRAWEVVEEFVNKHLRWNDDRTHAYIEKGAPPISKRVVDCVRRSGGWSCYLRMTDADFPFVQKRFFEEWEAWVDVDRIARDPARALVFPELKQLTEMRAMDRLERGRGSAPTAARSSTGATRSDPAPNREHVSANTARLTKLINDRGRAMGAKTPS